MIDLKSLVSLSLMLCLPAFYLPTSEKCPIGHLFMETFPPLKFIGILLWKFKRMVTYVVLRASLPYGTVFKHRLAASSTSAFQ